MTDNATASLLREIADDMERSSEEGFKQEAAETHSRALIIASGGEVE